MLFKIADADVSNLDRAEGLGAGYDKQIIQVETGGGLISAMAYVATDKQPGLKPYDWYKEHVLNGAREHGLPADYVRVIEAVESVTDPDAARAARERLIWAQ